MPVVDSFQFLKTLKGFKELPSLILVVGDEDALVSDSMKVFRAHFRERYGEVLPDFNLEVHYGGKTEGASVLEGCGTLPLGSDKKLVIVHQFEKFPPQAQSEIEDYCRSPNPSTCLVLLWNARPNQQTMGRGIAAAVSRSGLVVRCWKMDYEISRIRWIRERALRHGKDTTDEAASLLSAEGGESLRELGSEVEKLVLFVGDKRRIEARDVRETMSFRRHQLAWDFAEHFEKGDFKKAGKILERCLEQGEDPLKMLAIIARSLRRLPSVTKDRSANGAVRARLLRELRDTDLLLKSGHGSESAALERLLVYAAGAS